MLPYIIPDSSLSQERAYNSLLQLPDYEEAVMKQAPPPSYAVAMQQQMVRLPSTSDEPSTSASQTDSTSPPDYEMVVVDNTNTPATTPGSNSSSPSRQIANNQTVEPNSASPSQETSRNVEN
jgi:hypothetical protein